MSGSVRIDTSRLFGSPYVTVSITRANGSAPAAYTDGTLSTAVTFPQLISSSTSYYFPSSTPVSVSVKLFGTEIATDSRVPAAVFVEDGQQAVVAPSADKTPDAFGGGVNARPFGPRYAAIGDSITAGQGTARSDTFPNHAAIASGGKLLLTCNAGVSGTRSDQMFPQVAQVATSGASVCNILAGTNDIAQGVSLSTFITNIDTLVQSVVRAGLRPTLGTIPPRAAARAGTAQFNAALRIYAAKNNILLHDFENLLVDPSTGQIKAAYYSGDGTHPNSAGYQAMGALVASDLNPLLSPYSPLVASDATDTLNLIGNPMFLTNTSGVGTGWFANNSGDCIATIDSSDTSIVGNWQKITLTAAAGARVISRQLSAGWSVGDRLLYTGRVKTSGATFDTRIQLAQTGVGGQDRALDSVVGNGAFSGVFAKEYVVPAGVTALTFQAYAGQLSLGAGNGTLQVAQLGVYNLTQLGLDTMVGNLT